MSDDIKHSSPEDKVLAEQTGAQAELEAQQANDLPSLSIRRPVFILVANLLIALAGIAALMGVEIRELPDVDRPIVTVRAFYPGASPETMDNEVARILEGAVARVTGVKEISTTSEEGDARLRVEFQPGMNLDNVANDVREAVSRVTRRLPDRVEDVLIIKADADASPVVNLAVLSDYLSPDQITRLAENDIIPELTSIEGVADVNIYGGRNRILRVVVDPLRLTSFGLSVSDVAAVLRQASFDVPAGSFLSIDQELIVRADASTVTEEQVADIIIRDTIRVGDVAKVHFAPRNARNYTRLDGRQVVGLGVLRQARSNTIQISDDVRQAVDRLNERFAGSVELQVTNDDAEFIRRSVTEVMITMALTACIVVATIWVFLGSFRATLVPSVAIPVALIGTVAAIWLFGFSINILTLLALVLATGLVVDDAIVVLENIQRRRAQGLGALAAAVLGTRQVFFAVVATTMVLVSVFVPIAFLPGTAGRLFREFGLVLAVAVAISAFVALSLVPAMASRLPAADADKEGRIRRMLGRIGHFGQTHYEASLATVIKHPVITLLVALLLAASAGSVYTSLTHELVPSEDRGLIYVHGTGPDGVGINYMERQTQIMEDILEPLVASGEVRSLYSIIGIWDPNRTRITVPLSDWAERSRSQQQIVAALNKPLEAIPGVRATIGTGNSLNLRGAGSGSIQVALLGNDYEEIFEAAQKFTRAIENRSTGLSMPKISYEPTQPQLSVQIDRRRAADLGVSLSDLSTTLRAMVNGDEIIDLNVADEAVPIMLESSTGQIRGPMDLINLYVTARDGKLVPLASVVTLSEEGVAGELSRLAQRRAIQVDFLMEPGFPLQSAVTELRGAANDVLPAGITLMFQGEAATLEETSRDVAITYAIALLVVFLVLCAQFEGFTSAIVVTMIVPFGIAAAVFALFLSGITVNIYSQIGLVMLIGLMAKNGILLVEFADQLRDRGYDVKSAIQLGASVRLRPVAMTVISTVLGGLPLVLATGAGAEARNSIGWVIFGGLGLAALFTLYLTPALYVLIARFAKPRAEESKRLTAELQHAETMAHQH